MTTRLHLALAFACLISPWVLAQRAPRDTTSAPVPAGEDVNARFENLRAYSEFGNAYLSAHPNELFLAVPLDVKSEKVPGKARSKFEKGNQFLLKNEFDKAKQQYEAAISEYPNFIAAHVNVV